MDNPGIDIINDLISAMNRQRNKLPDGVYTADEIIKWLEKQKSFYSYS